MILQDDMPRNFLKLLQSTLVLCFVVPFAIAAIYATSLTLFAFIPWLVASCLVDWFTPQSHEPSHWSVVIKLAILVVWVKMLFGAASAIGKRRNALRKPRNRT